MKRAVRLALALIMALTFGFCLPGNATADDDDFAIEFGYLPQKLPYKGGNSSFTLTVRNLDDTKTITSFTVFITPNNVFKHEWIASIEPHESETISFNVPFEERDIGRELALYVSIKNDSDANPDGIRFATFTMTKVEPVFDVNIQFLPDSPAYRPGDRITVRMTMKNRMDDIPAVNVALNSVRMTHTNASMDNLVYEGGPISYGEMPPEAERVFSFQYTVTPDDRDQLMTFYYYYFRMMGYEYNVSFGKNHDTKPYDITFTASLSADHTTVTAGHDALLELRVSNTGMETIQGFEIYNPDGSLLRSMEAMPAGGSGMIDVNWPVSASGNVHYTVKGISGNQSKSVTSNNVAITVRAPSTPAPPPTPSPTPEPTPTPSPTPEPTPSPSPIPETTASPTPAVTEAPAASLTPIPTPSAAPTPAVTDNPQALNPQISPSAEPSQSISVPVWMTIPAAALIIAAVLALIWASKKSRERKWR